MAPPLSRVCAAAAATLTHDWKIWTDFGFVIVFNLTVFNPFSIFNLAFCLELGFHDFTGRLFQILIGHFVLNLVPPIFTASYY